MGQIRVQLSQLYRRGGAVQRILPKRVNCEMKQGRESITKLGPLVLFVTFGLSLALLVLVWPFWPW